MKLVAGKTFPAFPVHAPLIFFTYLARGPLHSQHTFKDLKISIQICRHNATCQPLWKQKATKIYFTCFNFIIYSQFSNCKRFCQYLTRHQLSLNRACSVCHLFVTIQWVALASSVMLRMHTSRKIVPRAVFDSTAHGIVYLAASQFVTARNVYSFIYKEFKIETWLCI